MLRFFLRHLSVIFVCCFIATSSYVLFDLLDIDGSNSQAHTQLCGEAVTSTPGEVSKPAKVDAHTARVAFPRAPLLAEGRLTLVALRPAPPQIFLHLTVLPRKAAQRKSTSPGCESDPPRQLA